MDFLNDIGKKVFRAARSVQELTREGMENTRLSADLRAAKSELDKRFLTLGRAYYAVASGDEDEVPRELIESVSEALAEIDFLNAQRDRVRASEKCPGCGAMQPEGARFCSNCGRRMPEAAPAPAEEASDADEEYCAECGAMRHGESKFCPVCGCAFADSDIPAVIPAPKADFSAPPEEPDDAEGYGE